MTNPVEGLKFTPTGSLAGIGLADWASEFYLNVKNFGSSVGTGGDDTAAVQACFDAAFGTSGSPHGITTSSNKTVFFPPGTYLVNNLKLTQVLGGRVIGSGPWATILQYNGASTGTRWIVKTDGFQHCSVEGITFSGGGPTRPDETGFDLDWSGSGSVGLSRNRFSDCYFGSLTIGLRVGNSGNEGHSNLFSACTASNSKYGFKIASAAALANCFISGGGSDNLGNGTTDRSACFWVAAGSISSFVDCSFAGQQTDIIWDSPETFVLAGGRSESWNALKITNGRGMILSHTYFPNEPTSFWTTSPRSYAPTGGTPDTYVDGTSPAVVILDCCSDVSASAVKLVGDPLIYLRGGTHFNSSAYLSGFTGTFREYMTTPPLTFATLPPAAEGCEVNITDANTATWGATVTGSSNTHGLVRWNGSNWTLRDSK